MGTLVIEQLATTGTPDDTGAAVYKDLVAVTNDATTSTSDETVTVDKRARYISVIAVSGDHRVTVNSATTGSVYYYVMQGERRDIALPAALGATIAYRLNA